MSEENNDLKLIHGIIRLVFEYEPSSNNGVYLSNNLRVESVILYSGKDIRDHWLERWEMTIKDAKSGWPINNYTYFVPPHRIIAIKLELS